MLLQWNNTGGAGGVSVPWSSTPSALLPPGFSLTRASTGTYFDSAGLLQTAAIDAARGTYRYNGSAWVFDGTLIEAAATNLALRSNEFTTAPWTAINAPTVTQNAAGPLGANTAWTLTDSSAIATSYVQAVFPTLTVANYTYSYYVKKTTGAQASYPIIIVSNSTSLLLASATIDTSNGTAAIWTGFTGFTITTSSVTVEDAGTFWRVRLTFLANADVTAWIGHLIPAGTANVNQTTGTFDVTAQGSAVFTAAQLELGSAATSYITTAAASATRSADVLTAPTSGLLANAQGFAAIKGRVISDATTTRAYLSTYSGAGGIPVCQDGIGMIVFDGALRYWNAVGFSNPAFGATFSIATTWGGAFCNGAYNGTVGTPQTFDGSMDFGATLRIGENVGAPANPISMVLQSLRLGTRTATNSELAGWTT